MLKRLAWCVAAPDAQALHSPLLHISSSVAFFLSRIQGMGGEAVEVVISTQRMSGRLQPVFSITHRSCFINVLRIPGGQDVSMCII